MAPNINNPGGVKNDPAEILDALTSDSTEFPGANIDAAVSSRATPADTGLGIDWSSKTPRVDRAGSITIGSMLSVTGSGYIIGVVTVSDGGATGVSLDIDGTQALQHPTSRPVSAARGAQAAQIIRSNAGNSAFQGLTSQTNCLFRFESSFTGFNNGGVDQQIEVSYVLD